MLNVRQYGEVAVIDLPRKLELGAGAEDLRETVDTLLGAGGLNIILNMSKTDLMDSSGLGEALACHKRVTDRGGAVKIAEPNRKVLDLFTVTRLDLIFEVFESEGDAILSF